MPDDSSSAPPSDRASVVRGVWMGLAAAVFTFIALSAMQTERCQADLPLLLSASALAAMVLFFIGRSTTPGYLWTWLLGPRTGDAETDKGATQQGLSVYQKRQRNLALGLVMTVGFAPGLLALMLLGPFINGDKESVSLSDTLQEQLQAQRAVTKQALDAQTTKQQASLGAVGAATNQIPGGLDAWLAATLNDLQNDPTGCTLDQERQSFAAAQDPWSACFAGSCDAAIAHTETLSGACSRTCEAGDTACEAWNQRLGQTLPALLQLVQAWEDPSAMAEGREVVVNSPIELQQQMLDVELLLLDQNQGYAGLIRSTSVYADFVDWSVVVYEQSGSLAQVRANQCTEALAGMASLTAALEQQIADQSGLPSTDMHPASLGDQMAAACSPGDPIEVDCYGNTTCGEGLAELAAPASVEGTTESPMSGVMASVFPRYASPEACATSGTRTQQFLLGLEDPRSLHRLLVLGMLGLGLFGAGVGVLVRASKKRQGALDADQEAGGSVQVDVWSASVRGLSASLLVFLAALSLGDAAPTPTFLLLLCFVAAVFSEKAWDWAAGWLDGQLQTLTPVTLSAQDMDSLSASLANKLQAPPEGAGGSSAEGEGDDQDGDEDQDGDAGTGADDGEEDQDADERAANEVSDPTAPPERPAAPVINLGDDD